MIRMNATAPVRRTASQSAHIAGCHKALIGGIVSLRCACSKNPPCGGFSFDPNWRGVLRPRHRIPLQLCSKLDQLAVSAGFGFMAPLLQRGKRGFGPALLHQRGEPCAVLADLLQPWTVFHRRGQTCLAVLVEPAAAV